MKKSVKGSYTVEAALIIPIILGVFVLLIYILFYYHDKNIVAGAAYETLVVGVGRKEYKEEELEEFFQERIKGKMLLFKNVEGEVQIANMVISIECRAKREHMNFTVKQKMEKTNPEKFIRDLRKISN